MLIKVIRLAFDSMCGGFPDEEILEFIKDKKFISSQEDFFLMTVSFLKKIRTKV